MINSHKAAIQKLAEFYLFQHNGQMLTDKQLKAIEKLETLARQKCDEISKERGATGIFHDPDYKMLSGVPLWAKYVRENHANPHAAGSIKGSLDNLRKVAIRFKFDLKE